MTCEVSLLDTLVKVSRIATPFVVVCLGSWLNRSIQIHGQNLKLTSEFNTKWSEQFISKCREFSENVTRLQFLIFNMHNAGLVSDSQREEFKGLTERINETKYKIEVHSALVDGSDDILQIVNEIFSQSSSNVESVKSSGSVDFETIKIAQSKLNKQLKEMQKSVLKL